VGGLKRVAYWGFASNGFAPKCIYIDVLRDAGTYSESEQRAKYRANGKLAARRSLEDFTIKMSDLVGDSPLFLLVTAEELTAPAWQTACAFAQN